MKIQKMAERRSYRGRSNCSVHLHALLVSQSGNTEWLHLIREFMSHISGPEPDVGTAASQLCDASETLLLGPATADLTRVHCLLPILNGDVPFITVPLAVLSSLR